MFLLEMKLMKTTQTTATVEHKKWLRVWFFQKCLTPDPGPNKTENLAEVDSESVAPFNSATSWNLTNYM